MVKLYLLGGENVSRRSAREINTLAFEGAGSVPEVLVFPWARPSFDERYGKRKLLSDYFRGIGSGAIEFVEYGMSVEAIAEKLAKANIAYLTGGQPSILIERLRTAGVDRLLRSYNGVIVGRSAGALALCQTCMATVRSNKRVKTVQGLGLVNINLKVHYVSDNAEILKQFSLKQQIFAVPENSALVCDNGQLSAIGNVFVFSKGECNLFNGVVQAKNRRT